MKIYKLNNNSTIITEKVYYIYITTTIKLKLLSKTLILIFIGSTTFKVKQMHYYHYKINSNCYFSTVLNIICRITVLVILTCST